MDPWAIINYNSGLWLQAERSINSHQRNSQSLPYLSIFIHHLSFKTGINSLSLMMKVSFDIDGKFEMQIIFWRPSVAILICCINSTEPLLGDSIWISGSWSKAVKVLEIILSRDESTGNHFIVVVTLIQFDLALWVINTFKDTFFRMDGSLLQTP